MGTLPTTFLTSDSTVFTGMASAMNIGGNFYGFNSSATPVEADRRALASDWGMTGKDVASALAQARPNSQCLTER